MDHEFSETGPNKRLATSTPRRWSKLWY